MSSTQSADVPNEDVRIMIVDDEPANTEFLRHVLAREGYGELLEYTDPLEALERIEEVQPDLVLLDLMMPDCDGYEFLQRLRPRVRHSVDLPVLVVTADTSAEAHRRALSLGARDFVTKPLSPADIRLRVRNLLETRFLQRRLRDYNVALEDRVRERTAELEATRLEVLNRLARAAEYRDDDTGQHTQRVGRLAARLAATLGEPEDRIELIRRAAPLHDIGKIGVPDSILLKPGRLTEKERAIMEDHTRIGADILSGSRFPLLQLAEEIARVHHEWWDGGGYPDGLAGEDIPFSGRIVTVADVFDSLTHERPYKAAWSVKEALTEIQDCSGSQFDPRVVEALLRIAPEVRLMEELVEARPGNGAGPRPGHESELPPAADPGGRVPDWAALIEERDRLHREVQDLRRRVAEKEAQIAALTQTAGS